MIGKSRAPEGYFNRLSLCRVDKRRCEMLGMESALRPYLSQDS